MALQINDNFDFTSPSPNFKRDNMTWEEMLNQSVNSLDKGHLVYCTTPEHIGTYVFTGKEGLGLTDADKWEKVLDESGKVNGIPTKTSELTNDSNFIPQSYLEWGDFLN